MKNEVWNFIIFASIWKPLAGVEFLKFHFLEFSEDFWLAAATCPIRPHPIQSHHTHLHRSSHNSILRPSLYVCVRVYAQNIYTCVCVCVSVCVCRNSDRQREKQTETPSSDLLNTQQLHRKCRRGAQRCPWDERRRALTCLDLHVLQKNCFFAKQSDPTCRSSVQWLWDAIPSTRRPKLAYQAPRSCPPV